MVDTTDLNFEQSFVSSQIQKSSFSKKEKIILSQLNFKNKLKCKGAETRRELPF